MISRGHSSSVPRLHFVLSFYFLSTSGFDGGYTSFENNVEKWVSYHTVSSLSFYISFAFPLSYFFL